jgi:hypothetical protein
MENAIMNPKRSIDGGPNLLAAFLLAGMAAVPAAAGAQGQAAASATPVEAAAKSDPAILLERARKKIKVDHDVAGAVAAYREVIEKHRADLAHARPALRELLDLWVEVQGNEAAAAAIRPAAEKYLDMQRPIDPKAAAARTDDDLARDLLLKPWLVTLKFDKAPLKEVLAEITRQSGVAIEVGTSPQPFDAAKYRALFHKLKRYAELPEEERKLLWDEMVAENMVLEGEGDPDEIMRQGAAELAGVTAERLEAEIQGRSQARQAAEELARSRVTIDVTGVTALAAIDAAGAALPTPQVATTVVHDAVYLEPSPGQFGSRHGNRVYQGRSAIWLSGQQRTSFFDAQGVRHSRLTTTVWHAHEPGLPIQDLDVRSAFGTDSRGRKFVMIREGHGANIVFQDVPAEVQELVTLTGEYAANVITERHDRRLPLTKGNRVETPEGTLTVQSIDTAEGQTVVTLVEALKDMSQMGVFAAASAGHGGVEADSGYLLELANGKRIGAHGMSMQGNEAGAEKKLSFHTGSAEPTALVWTVPTKTIPIVIPFEFKNVKLP